MSDAKTFVRNAADIEQVKEGEKRSRLRRDRELQDLRKVCMSIEGRRFVWRLLSHCQVFGSIWEPSAKIHYSSGKQDVGHFIMAEVVEAQEEILLQMMKESKQGDLDV